MDCLLHGTDKRGTKHPTAKLTEVDVLSIRSDDRFQYVIAEQYGISQSLVSKIKLRKTWAWL